MSCRERACHVYPGWGKAIVAPIVAAGGPAEWPAVGVTLGLGVRTGGNVLLAMLGGVGVVWVARNFL